MSAIDLANVIAFEMQGNLQRVRREDPMALARRAWSAFRRWWWRGVWELRVEGLEHLPASGRVLLCANHASHLDAPAILAALPRALALRTSTAAAKDVWADYPVRDFVARLVANALPIERGAGFAKGLRQLEAVLLEDRPLILFPEGKRTDDGQLEQFKEGAAMLAMRTGTPIVPIRLIGVDRALPKGAALPRASRVIVRFGPAIQPETYAAQIRAGRMDRKTAYRQITESLRAAIAA